MKIIIAYKNLYLCWALLLLGCASAPVPESAHWLTTETAHLVLHYQPGSYAAKNIKRAAAEYERSHQYAVQSLPFVNTQTKLDVYLHDSLTAAGHANRNNRSSHYVYSRLFRLTSPHEMLHHFLYELNPQVPLRVEEGLCRFFESRVVLGNSVRLYELARLTPQRSWNVYEVFQDHYQTDGEGNVSAAFSAFLVQVLGPNQFWSFYENLDKTRWEAQLQRALSKSTAEINRDFQDFILGLKQPPAIFSAI